MTGISQLQSLGNRLPPKRCAGKLMDRESRGILLQLVKRKDSGMMGRSLRGCLKLTCFSKVLKLQAAKLSISVILTVYESKVQNLGLRT
jgi:hypothetical protein